MEHLFDFIPEDIEALSNEELDALIGQAHELVSAVNAAPSEYCGGETGRTPRELIEQLTDGVAAIEEARAVLASRQPEETLDDVADELASLGERAAALAAEEPEETPEVEEPEALAVEASTETEDEEEPEVVEEVEEPVVASVPAPRQLGRPARSTAAAPVETAPLVPLVATAGASASKVAGTAFRNKNEIAEAMIKVRQSFGHIGEGASERVGIAMADWRGMYPEDRVLSPGDVARNMALVASVTDEDRIKAEFRRRRDQSLTAAGTVCAPVTPYYQLQQIATADRPVRAALAAFGADRGGIRFAAPAGLGDIDDAIGIITSAQDAAGGSPGTKTCQVVDCPEFSEVDVAAVFHCLTHKNLTARTFPELVAQWTGLTMAAHARLAESTLLTAIGAASTSVTASDLGLGASANYFSHILTAADGTRSRNRMSPDAVLRLIAPWWAQDLIISDVIRTQFQRFDTDRARVVALLRSFNIEPTFHLDGASGKAQVWGAQTPNSDLNAFPADVVSYLYPEGSFLYLDGGTLELGLVRDSVLNATNNYQMFGEIWENLAFVGVEALEITSTICDSGIVASPDAPDACGDYS